MRTGLAHRFVHHEKNQRPNSSIQQVRDAEPFWRTQRMKVHDGLKPDAIIAVSAFADTKATSEGRSATGEPPSAGAVRSPRLVDVGLRACGHIGSAAVALADAR